MAYAVVLTAVPPKLTAGESVSWSWYDSRFPASTWTLTYSLVSASVQILITATADGDKHLVEIGKTTSDAYTVGSYEWQAHVDNGTERYQVAVGVMEIVADFADQSSGLDTRSFAKKCLDQLEAEYLIRSGKTQIKQVAGPVQTEFMTHEQIRKERNFWRAEVAEEDRKSGKTKPSSSIIPRFHN